MLIKKASVELVLKEKMSDESMKEIANLQIFAARLFEGEEYLFKGIRMTLKR